MKYLKNFESKQDDEKKKKLEDDIQLLDDLINENPLNKDHDFYIFLAKDDFKESDGGMYKKTLDIENMVKIKPDANSLASMKGLEMRKMFQHDVQLYHIWLPKELEDDVSGKGSNRIEPWLVDLIDTHKRKGTDEHGKKVLKDVRQRNKDIEKYNL